MLVKWGQLAPLCPLERWDRLSDGDSLRGLGIAPASLL